MTGNLLVTCCDLPGADGFVLHVMAAVAKRERQMISEPTRAAGPRDWTRRPLAARA